MDVTVRTKCGRCGKKETKEVSLAVAQDMEAQEQTKKDAAAELPAVINSVLGEKYPDVIIAIKENDGVYTVKHLSILCSSPDATRNRGCVARVDTLLKDMLELGDKAPRKPRTPKAPKPTEENTVEKPMEKPEETKLPTPTAPKKTK